MTLEEEVKECCEDIEDVHKEASQLKESCPEDAKKDLSGIEEKLEHFLSEARAAREKLDSGVREGFEGLVSGWRETRDRLQAHMRLLEAKNSVLSAQRLTGDQYYMAAESALTTSLHKIQEAAALLPNGDAHLSALIEEIERVSADIREKAAATAKALAEITAANERLIAGLKHAA